MMFMEPWRYVDDPDGPLMVWLMVMVDCGASLLMMEPLEMVELCWRCPHDGGVVSCLMSFGHDGDDIH